MFIDSSSGRVLTVPAPLATGPFNFLGGLKFDGQGRVVVTTTEPIFNVQGGMPFAIDGSLCITEA